LSFLHRISTTIRRLLVFSLPFPLPVGTLRRACVPKQTVSAYLVLSLPGASVLE